MSKPPITSGRPIIVASVIVLVFAGVLARLYYLHIYEREALAAIAESNRITFRIDSARRGSIFDTRGNLLAGSHTVYEVGVDPQIVYPGDTKNWPALAALVDMPIDQLKSRMLSRISLGGSGTPVGISAVRWRELADAMPESDYEKVLALKIKGVYGNRKFQRVYPGQSLASHFIGFLNKEHIPVSGIERYMDFYLSGQDGWRETERDGNRRELAQFRSREIEPTNGLNVELTVDMVVQNIIEEELRKLATEFSPKAASIIVSDPSTGFILGMANWPNFDLNSYWKYPIDRHRNRAVADLYEPGSTFKIVVMGGALEESLVRAETRFNCDLNAVEYRGRLIHLPEDHMPMGELTLGEIVSKSSNRGAAQVGLLLGPKRLYQYALAFGFGTRTGYGPGGEVRGILHPVHKWDNLTISRLPIGYNIAATPLQVHFAMSVIANDGVLMAPRIVRRVFDQKGKTVVPFSPEPRRRAVSARTAHTLTRMLIRAAAPGGTAPEAQILGFGVAGKTGTTRKIIDGKYSRHNHVASFVGFFPASRPRLVITVVVDDPETVGPAYGGKIAAPAFRNIAEQLIQYLAIKPSRPFSESLAMEGGEVERLRY